MENTSLGSPGIWMCEVLYQQKKIILKNKLWHQNNPGETIQAWLFWAGVPPALSLSVLSADSVVSALKSSSVSLNWGIIHSRMYIRAIFRMCRLRIIHFLFTWGFRLCFILEWALCSTSSQREGGKPGLEGCFVHYGRAESLWSP